MVLYKCIIIIIIIIIIYVEAEKRGMESVHTATSGEVVGKPDDRPRHLVSTESPLFLTTIGIIIIFYPQ